MTKCTSIAHLREGLCPICGERLGRWKWFQGGPRSAFDPNGWYIDLPTHRECSEFALVTCPYLAMPKYLGRIDVVHPEKLPAEAALLLDTTLLSDRPEVFVSVASDYLEATMREMAGREEVLLPYVRPVRPYLAWTYWRHGRQISEEEAFPYLRAALGKDWTPPAKRE